MAGGIDINWNVGANKRRQRELQDQLRADRQREMLTYLPKLQEQYTPEEVSSIARRYIEGEGLNLPTMRSRLLPPEEGVDVPTRSVQEPLKYIEPSTTIVDKVTGEYKIVPGKNAKIYGNEPQDIDIVNYDEETGESKVVGKTKKGSKVITTKKPSGKGPKTAKEFQDEVAKDVLKNYFTLQATGADTSKIEESAISAAKRFGMTIESIANEPGVWTKLFGGEGDVTEKPSFTAPGIRGNVGPKAAPKKDEGLVKKGMVLTKEIAAKFLEQAKGDKEMARSLARKQGYKF